MNLKAEAIQLLKELIRIPSYSGEEDHTAECIRQWLEDRNIACQRTANNIIALNKTFDAGKPTLLLNSHHDTVRPNQAYTRDPFEPAVEAGRLYGLGSNDAGGALVSLLAAFVHFYHREGLAYNLVMVASGEEENSGDNGLRSVLDIIPPISLALVGEPTQMQMAIAEKGLIVFDGLVKGTASHAAHANADNPIYNSIGILQWFRDYAFEKVSETLGPVKMTVTQVKAGTQHNVIPAQLELVIDVRVNDRYTNQELAEHLYHHAPCELKARSLRHNSSAIPPDHPLVRAGLQLGRGSYGSPTLSDQAVLSCPSLKMGPGDSHRSHTADEYIGIKEIEEGVQIYIAMLEKFLNP